MLRVTAALLLAAFLASACNTMDGLVTDIDKGVTKLQGGEDRNR